MREQISPVVQGTNAHGDFQRSHCICDGSSLFRVDCWAKMKLPNEEKRVVGRKNRPLLPSGLYWRGSYGPRVAHFGPKVLSKQLVIAGDSLVAWIKILFFRRLNRSVRQSLLIHECQILRYRNLAGTLMKISSALAAKRGRISKIQCRLGAVRVK